MWGLSMLFSVRSELRRKLFNLLFWFVWSSELYLHFGFNFSYSKQNKRTLQEIKTFFEKLLARTLLNLFQFFGVVLFWCCIRFSFGFSQLATFDYISASQRTTDQKFSLFMFMLCQRGLTFSDSNLSTLNRVVLRLFYFESYFGESLVVSHTFVYRLFLWYRFINLCTPRTRSNAEKRT